MALSKSRDGSERVREVLDREVLDREGDGEGMDRHSDKPGRSGSCACASENGNTKLVVSTSADGDVGEGVSERTFSKRAESFRSPSRSAKQTRNGSSRFGERGAS